MGFVPPATALLAAAFLLLVPGLVLLACLRQRDRQALGWDEAAYLAVATSVAASAWLGLVLAEIGRFHLATAGVVLASASAVAGLVARARGRLAWPLPAWPGVRALAPAVAVLALAFALQARPSEYIVGGRDPGAYVAAMGTIARTGGLIYTDPAVLSVPEADRWLFFRHPEREQPFSWSRFMGFHLERPETGRVFPQFFHLFPAFGAYLFQSMGLRGALATPPVFGILGTLGVFLVARRLVGPGPALLAGLLLCLNVVQVWFARYPVSETVSQFLLFLGLLALLVWEETGSGVFGGVAGAVFGLGLLVRIDAVLIVIPLGLYVAWRRACRDLSWRDAAPLLLGFFAVAAHAGWHAATFAQRYLVEIVNRPYWRQPPAVWAALAAAGLGALWAWDRTGPWLVARLAGRGPRFRRFAAAGLVVLAGYAWFVRPQLSAWAGGDGNPPHTWHTSFTALDRDSDDRLDPGEFSARTAGPGDAAEFARLDADGDGGLRRGEWKGDPPAVLGWLGFDRLAAHDAQALVRFGWFVTPLGVVLGLAGLVLVLVEGRRHWAMPLMAALTFACFYFYKIRVFNDYPFAWRRYVPAALPFALVLAALALGRLGRGGRGRRGVAAVLAATLVVWFARDTARIATYTDWRGAVGFVRDVARRFGPEDVLVFEQPRSIHLLSLPLWSAFGVNILELARFDPDPDRLQHLVQAWRGSYRNVYFVHTYRTDLCGLFLERVEPFSFGSREWYAYNRRPEEPEPRSLHFTVSRVVPPQDLQVPALPELDIGASDDFQVSGMFDKEGGEQRTFRWTGPCASVYLPGVRPGAALEITAAADRRPGVAEVEASLSGVALGSFPVGAGWQGHRLRLPDPLPPGPPVLRLDMPGWRPVNSIAGSSDTRDLGIMLDRIRIEGGAKVAPPGGG